jgi:glucose-6-phosphate 1-dehydrogenase
MVGDNVELIARSQPADDMTPYELLLGDAMEGDAMLFASADSIEAAWRVVQPVLAGMPPPGIYDRGTWGPADANRLIVGDGRWHDPSPDEVPS